ncbi:carbohydrate esterase family 4 protein [Venturia nashicola]|uniref:Carbohydrate esterase family 4 protein n=1 Tax=Venturia nashicola TaxID=86259 RepID=A0A4Z1PUK8_9PEZI|nr:carbohydrate esterase family 4 protein [Venturia nashicola]TLD39761.1 carbohydrate esterase family 4 protein [Venturia nashicola]
MNDTDSKTHPKPPPKWPSSTTAAITLTLDNMGEAADLNRSLWPPTIPPGSHYSVTNVLPKILSLLKKYNIHVTYFIESWNLSVYGDVVVKDVAGAGHEVGWHAWQHEAWWKLDEREERGNFETSFGKEGVGRVFGREEGGGGGRLAEGYVGFRPPGGIVNGERTLKLCREYGLGYLSPAGEEAAIVDVGDDGDDKLVILPFKWVTVDAYFYMESFAGLRKMKKEYSEKVQSSDTLVQRYKAEIDKVVENGRFLALLFHPFLTNQPERLEAFETILKYLAQKRDEGKIWLARCRDVEGWIRKHPDTVGNDPGWDLSQWR